MREDDMVDYIVIGSGSAGSVTAGRLSANSGWQFVVLQAGGDDRHPRIIVPRAVEMALDTPRFDWGYRTESILHAAERSIMYRAADWLAAVLR